MSLTNEDFKMKYDDFECIEICGTPALFTNERLTKESIPDGLHLYHLRHSDDASRFSSLEKFVMVNFGGCVITKEPIELGENDCITFCDDTEPNFLGEIGTIQEFIDGDIPSYGFGLTMN